MTMRHAQIAKTIAQFNSGHLTATELAHLLSGIIATYPCDCMECTD